jgi:branched-chain amino acid transport system ATP-binding protein
MSEKPILEGRALDTFYGASHVLHAVDIAIRAGQCVGLMGRNGMGKTTLVKTLTGQLRQRRGQLRMRGQDVTGMAPNAMAMLGVAYVPEGRAIFPNLTVHENLVMAARLGVAGRNDWSYARVLDAFPRLGERLAHGGADLSGGEQQMLSIARALMTNPDVLLLDEATEGLAPAVAKLIWATIDDIKRAGVATVVIDKNYRAVASIAEHNVVLVKGSVVFAGSSEALLAQPALLQSALGV